MQKVTVIGGGLAGSEASLLLAEAGVPVVLVEQKAVRRSPAHKTDALAELVCSNSLRSDNPENAIGLLHEELRRLGSAVLEEADRARVPAGDALAVDRAAFSEALTRRIAGHPNIELRREEATALPADLCIVATGPLTGEGLARALADAVGDSALAFYDAIAPIVAGDSIDQSVAFRQSRYGKGGGDGREVLAFGPMKPVGLIDPRTGRRPHAVVQLRREDQAGTAWNLVGFQTRLTWPEQKRIFASCIPGLRGAEWIRLGQVHRNTFLDAPRALAPDGTLRSRPQVFCAGQITGVEGYVESAASGHLAARRALARVRGGAFVPPPGTTALGALLRHVTGEAHPEGYEYQPTNVVFALFPPLEERHRKHERKARLLARARRDLAEWARAQGVPLLPEPPPRPAPAPSPPARTLATAPEVDRPPIPGEAPR